MGYFINTIGDRCHKWFGRMKNKIYNPYLSTDDQVTGLILFTSTHHNVCVSHVIANTSFQLLMGGMIIVEEARD